TGRVLEDISGIVRGVPEATAMEAYVGTSAPFNFNGLVRHYFLRSQSEQGDVMVTLLPKGNRSRSSHEIAIDLRERLKALKLPDSASIKVVETPPGPPVLATLLAEVYGPDAETRRKTAAELEKIFKSVPYIVDVDNSFGEPRPKLRLDIQRDRIDYYGLSHRQTADSIGMLMGSQTVGYAPRGDGRSPLPITIGLEQKDRSWTQALSSTPVAQGADGQLIDLGAVVDARTETGSPAIFRRDGRYADMVTAELAGAYEAPIYGKLAVNRPVEDYDWAAKARVKQGTRPHGPHADDSEASMLWDGEWEITWVTFRDMGAAFMVALL